MLDVLYILIGVVVLYIGGEAMVHGAYRGALRVGMTALTAGLIVVSLTTSLPEAVASLIAQVWQGKGSVALGNVVGSNIANIGLIVGITALVRPLEVSKWMRIREMPLMLSALILLVIFMLGDNIVRWNGSVMLGLLALYLGAQVWIGKKEHQSELAKPPERGATPWLRDILLIIGGAVALVVGGFALIHGAVNLATKIGLSDRVIGLTIVAIGTSFPELAASVVAALRGHNDIALGNAVGSSIFNCFLIAGGVALIRPMTFSHQLLTLDAPIMLGISAILWLLMIQKRLGRLSGAFLVILYGVYLTLCLLFKI